MRVLVLGATGMLGSAAVRVLSERPDWIVSGTVRSQDAKALFPSDVRERLVTVEDLVEMGNLVHLFDLLEPQVVVNCTALRKSERPDPMRSISIFSLLPQRLAHLCEQRGARLVHVSSDGVFSGARGGYTESDLPDATDLYGISKLLGEVAGPHAVTLRTSIIGHELGTKQGLLEWFLAQEGECRCYTQAIFSGLPTVVLAGIIRDVVIPQSALHGIYHVAAEPISKFDLLTLIAREYGKSIIMVPDDTVVTDRSLVADRFRDATQYVAPGWPELVSTMHSYQHYPTRV